MWGYFPMDEANGNNVPSQGGMDLTLSGAEIIPEGVIRGALQVRPDIDGYATGKYNNIGSQITQLCIVAYNIPILFLLDG